MTNFLYIVLGLAGFAVILVLALSKATKDGEPELDNDVETKVK